MPKSEIQNCDICGTEIKSHEGSYAACKEYHDDKVRVHSDCMIRELEFCGDFKKAEEIQIMDEYYAKQIEKKKDL